MKTFKWTIDNIKEGMLVYKIEDGIKKIYSFGYRICPMIPSPHILYSISEGYSFTIGTDSYEETAKYLNKHEYLPIDNIKFKQLLEKI